MTNINEETEMLLQCVIKDRAEFGLNKNCCGVCGGDDFLVIKHRSLWNLFWDKASRTLSLKCMKCYRETHRFMELLDALQEFREKV